MSIDLFSNSGAVGDDPNESGSGTNKTEAPTSASTGSVQAAKDSRLTESQLDFVTLMSQHWGLYGAFLSADAAYDVYELDPTEYIEYLNKPAVLNALEERGVNLKDANVDVGNKSAVWKGKILNPKQLIIANMMLDLNDTRSDKKKLQDSGVSTQTWQAWLRDPVFQNYVRTRAEVLLTDTMHEGHLALMDKVKMGDVKAIQLYYEVTGRFVPKSQGDVQSDQIQFKTLITKFVEIIIDEVDDPELAGRLADRLKTLVTTNAVTDKILEGPEEIKQPDVMPNREMTPELEAFMSKGGGMAT